MISEITAWKNTGAKMKLTWTDKCPNFYSYRSYLIPLCAANMRPGVTNPAEFGSHKNVPAQTAVFSTLSCFLWCSFFSFASYLSPSWSALLCHLFQQAHSTCVVSYCLFPACVELGAGAGGREGAVLLLGSVAGAQRWKGALCPVEGAAKGSYRKATNPTPSPLCGYLLFWHLLFFRELWFYHSSSTGGS